MKIWGRREQRKVGTCPHLEDPAPMPHGWDRDGNRDWAGLRFPGSPACTIALPTPGNAIQGEGTKYVEGAGGGRRPESSAVRKLRAPPCGEVRAWFSDKHQKRPFIPLTFPGSLPSPWLVPCIHLTHGKLMLRVRERGFTSTAGQWQGVCVCRAGRGGAGRSTVPVLPEWRCPFPPSCI